MKNFFIKISILCAILSLPIGMSAQKYVGTWDGRECTLDMSPQKSLGYLAVEGGDIVAYKDMKEVDCAGTLEIYFGGYIDINILDLEFTSDTDGTEYYLATMDSNDSRDDTFDISLKYGPGKKTVVISDESRNPMFKGVKLKLAK